MSYNQHNDAEIAVKSYLKHHYPNYADFARKNANENLLRFSHRLEPRSRNRNLTNSLSFRIHDPLWMLTRQWQFGEFRGNDAGSAIVATASLKAHQLNTIRFGNQSIDLRMKADAGIEPSVERINEDLTTQVGVESALYFRSLIKHDSTLKPLFKEINERCKILYPLVNKKQRVSLEHEEVRKFSEQQNSQAKTFENAYVGKAFDGRSLYHDLKNKAQLCQDYPASKNICELYIKWFESRYLPHSESKSSAWNTQKLGYEFEAQTSNDTFVAEDYHSGRVSWYSFDHKKTNNGSNPDREYKFVGLPTLARFEGAPNKRLWQFEDRKVYMGNSDEMQSTANGVTLQYVTMYGNDWMLIPLDVTIGSLVSVNSIKVRDTFGITTNINERAGSDSIKAHSFGNRWELFTQAPMNILNETSDSRKSSDALFFPPALPFTIESQPIEEIQFLRDEMANMVWGVELRVNDGYGSFIDCKQLAASTAQFIEDFNDEIIHKPLSEDDRAIKITKNEDGKTEAVQKAGIADYRYILQNSVPLNWIPFLPQRIQDDKANREIALRRGKMPIYMADIGKYLPARPISSLLRVEKGIGSVKEVPLYINEEEILGVGTKVVCNFQRSRWLNGQVCTWYGTQKQISQMQGDSGLMFDELIEL